MVERLEEHLLDDDSVSSRLLDGYFGKICAECGINPRADNAKHLVFTKLKKESKRIGLVGNKSRWMSSYDCGKKLLATRSMRLAALDFGLVIANALPPTSQVVSEQVEDFSVSQLMSKLGNNSQLVASWIFKCSNFWKVPCLSNQISPPTHKATGV